MLQALIKTKKLDRARVRAQDRGKSQKVFRFFRFLEFLKKRRRKKKKRGPDNLVFMVFSE